MGRFKTHYDNLQVGRHASAEVISAAYRTLSRKYHPDLNEGDERSQNIMRIINRSYEVLSNSEQRAAHDEWIARMEGQSANPGYSTTENDQSKSTSESEPTPPPKAVVGRLYKFSGLYLLVRKMLPSDWIFGGFLVLTVLIVWAGIEFAGPSSSGLPQYERSPSPSDAPTDVLPAYSRPLTAPNGTAWPSVAGYIQGAPRLRSKGLSTVTVDNSQNASDVFVKLVVIDTRPAHPVRQFFIPAYGQFEAKNINAGEYDVRYKDLSDGSLARSESFTLKEIREEGGTKFSNTTMTLYKVANGNMRTYPLSESEF